MAADEVEVRMTVAEAREVITDLRWATTDGDPEPATVALLERLQSAIAEVDDVPRGTVGAAS